LFNPVKGGVAGVNYTLGAWAVFQGILKVGASPVAPYLLPVAAWNFNSANAAFKRGAQQWSESLCEDISQADTQNLWGILPGGTNYDDVGEPNGPLKYIKTTDFGRFIKEMGLF
jgi:hypothetical protein